MDKQQPVTGDIQQLIDNLMILQDIYTLIRIVDPIHKSVFVIKDNVVEESETNCHDFWGRDKICDNCISMRAYNSKETMVKIDYSSTKVIMLTAVPMLFGERQVVVEMIRDVTNSMYVSGDSIENDTEFRTLIDNLSKAAYKDGLTDLFNRRFIGERLPVDLVECMAVNQPISLIMCDLDHLKKVNDTFGQAAGDCILRTAAKILVEKINSEKAWIARYGNEDFLVCLPYTAQKAATDIAEAMRQAIEQAEYQVEGKLLTATISCGVYTLIPNQNIKYQQLIESANKFLYEAKRTGRNKVAAPVDIPQTAKSFSAALEELISSSKRLSCLDVLKIASLIKEDANKNYLVTGERLFQLGEQAFFKQLAEHEFQHMNIFNAMYEKKKNQKDTEESFVDDDTSKKLKTLIRQHTSYEDRTQRTKKTGTVFGDFSTIRKAIQWKLDFYEIINQQAYCDEEIKTVFNDVTLEEMQNRSQFEKKINEFMYK